MHLNQHKHTQGSTLSILTLHVNIPQLSCLCEAPGSCFILWALAPHTTQWGLDATMQIWPCCCWTPTRTIPEVQGFKTKTYKLKKDSMTCGISKKSSLRQWVRNVILTERRKDRDRAGRKRELESKQLALVSKSTLNRRQNWELCTGKNYSGTAKK